MPSLPRGNTGRQMSERESRSDIITTCAQRTADRVEARSLGDRIRIRPRPDGVPSSTFSSTTRSLGLEDFSPISQLWTVWAIAAAVVTFSTQVVTVRREVLVGRTAISRTSELMPLLLLLAIVMPVLILYRVQIFGDSNALWPIIGILIPLGSFATGKARGWLAVHGSSAQLAGVVGGENLVRGVIAVGLALIDAPAIWYGLAILAGYSVALVGLRGIKRSEPGKGEFEVGDRWIPASASTAGICDLLLLVTAPTVLATSADNPALVSALFVAMAVYRVPYQFVLGLLPSLTRTFTETLRAMPASEIRRRSIRVGTWSLLACVAAAICGLLIGESIIAPIFAAQGLLDPIDRTRCPPSCPSSQPSRCSVRLPS